jgi:hypothetical protein
MAGPTSETQRQVPKVSEKATDANGATLALANPCIEITPSPEQYEQLCRDLAALRGAGASSNTAAVISAVHEAAVAKLRGG